MRGRRWMGAAMAAALLAGGSALVSPARAATPGDWVELTVAGGSDGGLVNVTIDGHGQSASSDALVYGEGWNDTWGSGMYTSSNGLVSSSPGDKHVVVAGPNHTHDLSLHRDDSGDTTWGLDGATFWVNPGATLHYLFFVAGLTQATADVTSSTDSGSATVTSAQGTGSTVLLAANQGPNSFAVDAGFVAVGKSATAVTPTAGIAGAMVNVCAVCKESWTSPDGRKGAVNTSPGPSGASDYELLGPAGPWSFTWSGAADNLSETRTPIGAFAPIGDDWHLFQSVPSDLSGAPDWLEFVVTAGATGVDHVAADFSVDVATQAGGELVIGTAETDPFGSDSYVADYGYGGGSTVRVTTPKHSYGSKSTSTPGLATQDWGGIYEDHLEPGQTAKLLFFVPGGAILNPVTDVYSADGDYTLTTNSGTGSAAVRVGDGTGFSVTAYNLQAGKVTAARSLTSGAVGAIANGTCACRTVVTSPSGTTDSGLMPVASSSTLSFTGPAGGWSFAYTGVDPLRPASSTLVAAYAPVADWQDYS